MIPGARDVPAPFLLLMAAIAAVWLPAWRFPAGVAVAPCTLLYGAAVVGALMAGYVLAPGAMALLVLAGLAAGLRRAEQLPAVFWSLYLLLLALAVALTLHLVPGFKNPVAMQGVRFSADTRPFTQYLNFDKGSVGLCLLALLAPRLQRADRIAATLLRTLGLTLAVAALTLGLATVVGMVRPDPKWPDQAVPFLVANLFLTCVAEEALFRLLVQDRLSGQAYGAADTAARVPAGRVRTVVAVAVSALLFGAAHAGGGLWMTAIAGLAGVGYAAAYAWRRRIEVAILIHFGVNAIHFCWFSYPALSQFGQGR